MNEYLKMIKERMERQERYEKEYFEKYGIFEHYNDEYLFIIKSKIDGKYYVHREIMTHDEYSRCEWLNDWNEGQEYEFIGFVNLSELPLECFTITKKEGE